MASDAAMKSKPASVNAVGDGTLDKPVNPKSLPTEVEEFLDMVIKDAIQVGKDGNKSSDQATKNFIHLVSIPEELAAAVPEARTPETDGHSGQDAKPLAPEALGPNPRGWEHLAGRDREKEKNAHSEHVYSNSLALAEKKLGPDHPETADLLSNLALLLHKQGKHAEAETLHQKALRIRENSLGTEHPKVATSLNNLALLYRDQGRNAEAQELWERSVAIVEKAFGPEHPKTALRISNLADLFYIQRKYDRAEPLYQRLVAILEKGLEGKRPDVTASLTNYMELLRNTDRQEEARQVQTRIETVDGLRKQTASRTRSSAKRFWWW